VEDVHALVAKLVEDRTIRAPNRRAQWHDRGGALLRLTRASPSAVRSMT
jgi:hypothetical protein